MNSSKTLTQKTAVQILWDYLNGFKSDLSPVADSDMIFVFGCNDIRVAKAAAEFASRHQHSPLIFCGGLGRLSKTTFTRSEAEIFAQVAIEQGVDEARVILEKNSTNTGDNVRFARQLLAAKGLNITNPILVCKNVMRPRVWATFAHYYPELTPRLVSAAMDFDDYCQTPVDKLSEYNKKDSVNTDAATHLMVGEIDRLILYPDQGYMQPVAVPDRVVEAANLLKQLGYVNHSLKK